MSQEYLDILQRGIEPFSEHNRALASLCPDHVEPVIIDVERPRPTLAEAIA
jgi:uncharacterized repeat protein (TIGR04076 family)